MVTFLYTSDWKKVDSKEEEGFFKGEVLSEAEMNFSLKIYNVCDIYKLAEIVAVMAMIAITAIFVVVVTELVVVNVASLEAYIEIYGIKGGIEMYRLLGTSNVENGLVGALQAERENGRVAAMLVKEFSNGSSTHGIKATERLTQLRNLASSG